MSRRGLVWMPADWLLPVVVGAVVAAAGIVWLGRPDLVVFAAPLIGALAGAWWTTAPSRQIRVEAEVSVERVVEGDTVTLTAEIEPPAGVQVVGVELEVPEGLGAEPISWSTTDGVSRGQWRLTVRRWGRWNCTLDVALRAGAGLMTAGARYHLPEVRAYPSADTLSSIPRPVELPDLLGAHLSRRRGEGVEFGGVRDYQPGDQQRSINWPVTARRGRLHVTERLAEQAAKVVVLVDASADIRQPGGSTLELSVLGTLGVVQGSLRRGDRAGVIVLGGSIRWMAPGMGRRHLHRVVESLIDVERGGGAAPAGFAGFPRAVLPPGSAVVVFSPLVDERMVGGIADLRRRGFGIVVVDVLRAEPEPRPTSDYDDLAVRMWRIGRRGVRHRLADLGVQTVVWTEGAGLDEVLRPTTRRPLAGSRR